MMEKLSIQDITEQLAAGSGVSKHNAEDFIKTLFHIIEEDLLAGNSVKISNFGTLKLQWVEPRKSVNVATGEEFVIEGYYKVHFTPENSLKELVNEPLAHLQAVSFDEGENVAATKNNDNAPDDFSDPIKRLGKQADEIKNILNEIKAESRKTNKQNAEAGNIPSENPKTEISENATPKELNVNNSVYSADDIIASFAVTPKKQKNKKIKRQESINAKEQKNKKTKIWLFIFIPLAALVAGLFVWDYFDPNFTKRVDTVMFAIIQKFDSKQKSTLKNPPLIHFDTTKTTAKLTKNMALDSIPSAPVDSLEAFFADDNRTYSEFLGEEKVQAGTRLTTLSHKYYGHKNFWVYIYEANKEKIKNPDNLIIETVLNIPKLNSAVINADNPRCLQEAKRLHDKYVRN